MCTFRLSRRNMAKNHRVSPAGVLAVTAVIAVKHLLADGAEAARQENRWRQVFRNDRQAGTRLERCVNERPAPREEFQPAPCSTPAA